MASSNKVASQVNRYQAGIGQGNGSTWTPNSGQVASQGGFQRPLAPATTIVGQYMPYTDASDPNLPEYVQKLPDLKKRQWIAVWNSSYKRCRDKGGDDCESSAFAQANGVVKVKATRKDLDDIAKNMPWRLVEHQVSQLDAQYKPTGGNQINSCANCQFFVSPDACLVVSGDISPTGVSDYWHQRVDSALENKAPGEHEDPAEYSKILGEAADKALGESLTGGANTTPSKNKKVSQDVAEYSPTGGSDVRSCSNCFYYEGNEKCYVVDGRIVPNGVSSYWTAQGVNNESEADDMASGSSSKTLDESTLGLLLDWAQENPDQVEFMLDNMGKSKAQSLDPINQFHNMNLRDDRPANSGPTGIYDTADFLGPDAECLCDACTAVDDTSVAKAKELGGLSWALTKDKLTTSARDSMNTSQFAYVDPQGGKHFPINDENHVRNALARLNQSPYGPKAKAKVCAAARRMNIDAPSCSSGGEGAKSFKAFVKSLFNSGECANCGDSAPTRRAVQSRTDVLTSSLFKDKLGRLRVYFRASNNYKDLHKEIITEAAHKDYEHFVDTYEQYPEFWLWHTKGSRWGQADVVTYADGFLHVFGTVDPGCEDIARAVVREKCAVSHGFITFNQKNNIISKYRSWEMSPLPRGAEANPWFTAVGFVDLKKEATMGFAPAKRAWMQELGVPSDMIKALEEESETAKGFLDGIGVDSKAVDKPKAEAGVAGQAKRKRPAQLNTAVGKDDNDDDTEPDGDEDDAPTRKGLEINSDDLVIVLKSLSDRMGAIESALGVNKAATNNAPQTADDTIRYMASLSKAAEQFSPTRPGASNVLDANVAKELEGILGRDVNPGADNSPNAWFHEVVNKVH